MTDSFADGDLQMRAAALRSEWRDDEEAWTRAAHEQWEHGRTLRDVALDSMRRGDCVTITTTGAVLRGRIVAVGLDTVRLVDDGGFVDVLLASGAPLLMQVDTRPAADAGGVAVDATFRSRLLEHEGCTEIELGVSRLDGPFVGALRVSADHVRVRTRDGADAFVPQGSVVFVRERHLLHAG